MEPDVFDEMLAEYMIEHGVVKREGLCDVEKDGTRCGVEVRIEPARQNVLSTSEVESGCFGRGEVSADLFCAYEFASKASECNVGSFCNGEELYLL